MIMSYKNRLVLMGLLDACIICLAVVLAYQVRFDFDIGAPNTSALLYAAITHVALGLAGLYITRMYRPVLMFASVAELISIIKLATLLELGCFLLQRGLQYVVPAFAVPRSIYLISWAFVMIGLGGARMMFKIITATSAKSRPNLRRTLIVGAGSAGVLVAKELTHSPDSEQYPVAFIDDDKAKRNLQILGLPVLGGREKIPEVIRQYDIQDIIIAIPSATKKEVAEIVNICNRMKVSIKILPKVSDLLSGKISMKMIRDVKIEDLLGRDPVAVDLTEVSNYISGETVLVTGAGGSIGSELSRQIARHQPWKLLLLGHSENSIFEIELELRKQHPQLQIESVIADVRDWRRMKAVFAAHLPKVVFHAAAHKHVPLMERNPVEAIKTNIIGTKNVAELSHHNGVSRFVLVSTDKAVNPVSIMGVSKRVAEMFVLGLGQRSQTKFVAVRFGNVMGSSGSVIPIFKRQIQHGGPVTITHPEMVRYFMTIPEAVQLIIQAGALASGSEIFILDMGKPIKIDKLARDLIRLSGFEPEVDIKVIYTGIRPGEKLYEELLTNEEGIAATRHGRIFVEKQLQITWHEFLRDLDQLEQLVENEVEERFDLGMKQLLQKIVPNYQAPFSAEQQEKVLQVQNSSHHAKVEIVTNV